MPALVALAASVGVLAVAATWLFFGIDLLSSNNLQVWIVFVAWGCHFHSGGGVKGSTTAIVSMSFGAIVGMCAAIGAGSVLSGLGGAWPISVAVGIGAAVICLASKFKLLETIPAGVYGFASIFGLLAVKDVGGGDLTPQAALLPTVLSVVIGAAFGIVSEKLAGALTKTDPSAV